MAVVSSQDAPAAAVLEAAGATGSSRSTSPLPWVSGCCSWLGCCVVLLLLRLCLLVV
jgi:hypothetical protein